MYGVRKRRVPWAGGIVWPDTGTDTPIDVSDIFGGRLFPAHVSTVGYDYDMHRGVDLPLLEGDDYLSPANGRVSRLNRSHFPFNTTAYQSYWVEDDDGYGSTWSHANPGLSASCTRGGSNSFPTCDKYIANKQGIDMTAGQWELRVKLNSSQASLVGAIGVGVYDTLTSQYVTMEWDGTDVRCMGARSGGNLSNHNTTASVTSGHYWLRVRSEGTTLQLATSSDGDTWTNKFTESNPTWTNADKPSWRAVLYYRSKDTNATAETLLVDYVGWYDSNTIGRFGNWVTVSRESDKFVAIHFDDIYVEQGDYISAGQAIGTVGLTGFDDRSGTISAPHVHVEYAPVSAQVYDNDESLNPLGAGIMPRSNVSNNVSVVVSSDQDPDSVDSHKLVITCTRQDQDFDMNEFSLTGNTNTRTINWNTRSGLNADNDIPKNSGVYIVASSFNDASASYVVTIYFNKSTVGSTLVSAYIKDTGGNTLWSI